MRRHDGASIGREFQEFALLMTTDGYDRSGSTYADRYRLIRRLGSGGMGEVYLAHHELLSVPRALKLLRGSVSPDVRPVERLHREARALAAVRHPNVVAVHDLERDNDELALVMEYVEGDTLLAHVQQSGPLSLQQATALLDGIARGLDAIHDAGILHRDLKPSNILLSRGADGTLVPRIVDFGIALSTNETEQLTAPQQVLGTPAFMSPEQASALPLCRRSDVFSLACVAAFVLSGRVPRIAPGRSPELSAWPEETRWPGAVRAVLREGLQRFEEDRQASAGELARQFREAVHGVERGAPTNSGSRESSGSPAGIPQVTSIVDRKLSARGIRFPVVPPWLRWASIAVVGVGLGVLLSAIG